MGDGQLKVTDWVQAGRYLQGLEAPLATGGPTNEIAPVPPGPSASRKLRLVNTNVLQGAIVTLAVILDAQGNENAFGGTLDFNPTAMSFGGLTSGTDAGAATLDSNLSLVGAGRVGFAVALPPGTTFIAGQKEILRLSLNASNSGTFPVTLSDQIVTRCVSDALAGELPASFDNGSLTINPSSAPSPALSIQQSGSNVVLSWEATAASFGLQRLDEMSGNWSNLPVTLQTNGTSVFATVPATNLTRFFRLASP